MKNAKFTCSNENVIKTKEEKENWKKVHSEQNQARLAHVKKQTDEVRKRMKKSLKESYNARGGKSIWKQFYLLLTRENKVKINTKASK